MANSKDNKVLVIGILVAGAGFLWWRSKKASAAVNTGLTAAQISAVVGTGAPGSRYMTMSDGRCYDAESEGFVNAAFCPLILK